MLCLRNIERETHMTLYTSAKRPKKSLLLLRKNNESNVIRVANSNLSTLAMLTLSSRFDADNNFIVVNDIFSRLRVSGDYISIFSFAFGITLEF